MVLAGDVNNTFCQDYNLIKTKTLFLSAGASRPRHHSMV